MALEHGGAVQAYSKQPAYQALYNNLDTVTNNAVGIFDAQGNLITKSHALAPNHKFKGLWPGDYYLLFYSYQFTTETGCNPQIYHGEWYGGSQTFEDAIPLRLEGLETLDRVIGNLSLDNPPPLLPGETSNTFQVTGRVVDESDNPIAGVTVTAEAMRSPAVSTLTNANGEYTLNLENGDYTITFAKVGYDFSDTSKNVMVDGSDQSVEEISVPENPVTTPQPPAENDPALYLPIITR